MYLYSKENTLRKGQDWLKESWEEYGESYGYYKLYCFYCGDEFYARNPKAKYCSARCVNDAYILRRKARKQ